MLVCIINYHGKPLMPTKPSKARLLLKKGKAKIHSYNPFTLQLLYGSSGYRQQTTMGVDSGSKHVGLSVSTEKQELYASELELRRDIVELLSARRQVRSVRRNRKTRYREARFLNRRKSKGWLAPSVQNKIDTHIKVIDKLYRVLPISKIRIEVASFDIQKIKNPDIQGFEYQRGEQENFWNIREYVFWRDDHKCHGKHGCKNKILNVHHIESRKTGGNSPDNLITLCEECHKAYHAGKLKLNLKRGQSFRDAAFMGIMRWAVYNALKVKYPCVELTYGYITKSKRIAIGLNKAHRIDAYCIADNLNAKFVDDWYYQKQVRGQNRQLYKSKTLKGGIRKANKAQKYVYGYRLFDKVELCGHEGFIFGRRTRGSFDIRHLDGTKISSDVSYKKLKLIERSITILTERRSDSSPCLTTGVPVAQKIDGIPTNNANASSR